MTLLNIVWKLSKMHVLRLLQESRMTSYIRSITKNKIIFILNVIFTITKIIKIHLKLYFYLKTFSYLYERTSNGYNITWMLHQVFMFSNK